jgi:hypothetical protein
MFLPATTLAATLETTAAPWVRALYDRVVPK